VFCGIYKVVLVDLAGMHKYNVLLVPVLESRVAAIYFERCRVLWEISCFLLFPLGGSRNSKVESAYMFTYIMYYEYKLILNHACSLFLCSCPTSNAWLTT
jgi:hypothetical protein